MTELHFEYCVECGYEYPDFTNCYCGVCQAGPCCPTCAVDLHSHLELNESENNADAK